MPQDNPQQPKRTDVNELGGDNAYNMFVPGLLIITALFSSLFVGFGLIENGAPRGTSESGSPIAR